MIRLLALSLSLAVAAPAPAQFSSLLSGGMGGIGSAGVGNAAGLLGYCVKNKLAGGGAQGVLGKLTGQQPAVTQSPDYKQGLLGLVTGKSAAGTTATAPTAPAGRGLSLDSLPGGLRTKACDLVLKCAGSFL